MKLSGWVNDEMKGKNGEDMGACVAKYKPFIRRQAHRFLNEHSVPLSVDIEDLVQEGCIKLIECQQRYEVIDGASFETYFMMPLTGCFLDFLRGFDEIGRSQRRRVRRLTDCINGSPRIERTKLTQQLGITYEELEELLLLGSSRTVPLEFTVTVESGTEEMTGFDTHADSKSDPETLLAAREVSERIVYMLEKQLTGDRERAEYVFDEYFLQGRNLREIGDSLGVSESRMCQVMGAIREIITTVLEE